jgi:hypothetical protein
MGISVGENIKKYISVCGKMPALTWPPLNPRHFSLFDFEIMGYHGQHTYRETGNLMVHCPSCHGNRLRRSRTKGLWERLLKPWGWRAYRCREKSCGWRGLIKTKSIRQIVKEVVGPQKYNLLALGATIVVVVLLFYYMR